MTATLAKKNNKYHVIINTKDEHGERKLVWRATGISAIGNTKTVAKEALKRIVSDYEKEQADLSLKQANSSNIYFHEFIEIWMKEMYNKVQINTYEGYKYTIDKHILPYFKSKNILLTDIRASDIQKYYNCKLAERLTANTIKHHHANIRKCLQSAVELEMIPTNVADKVKLSKISPYVAKYYNNSEAKKLFEVARGSVIEPAIYLGIFCGLRRSEILGLKWNAVDFENKTLSIHTTVTTMKTTIEKERTKNLKSNRTLPLSKYLEDYLKELKTKQEEMKTLYGKSYVSNDYVCKWDDGKPLKPDYISRAFKKLLADNNLPSINFHGLRHTCASMLSALGHDIKNIQEYLGHSTITTTANLYTHLEFKSKIQMGEDISNSLC